MLGLLFSVWVYYISWFFGASVDLLIVGSLERLFSFDEQCDVVNSFEVNINI